MSGLQIIYNYNYNYNLISLCHACKQGSNCEKWTGRVSNIAGTKGLGGHNGKNRGTGGRGVKPPTPRQFEPCLQVIILFPDELHVPLDVCGAAVKRELDFWQIEDTLIKACCWISYSSHIGNERTLRKFDQDTQLQKDLLELDSLKGWRKKQMQLWLVLDHPRSSTLAMVGQQSINMVMVEPQ